MFIIFPKASIFQTFRLHFKLFKSGVVDIFNLCICSSSKLHCHSGNSPLCEFCWQAETTFQYRSSMFFSKQYLALQPNFTKKRNFIDSVAYKSSSLALPETLWATPNPFNRFFFCLQNHKCIGSFVVVVVV